MQNDDDPALAKAAELLQDLAYQAQIDQETRTIRSGTGGLKFTIVLTGTDIFQFTCGVELGERKLTLEEANDFNRSYRFSKIFIDEDSDVVLMGDYIVNLSDESANEQLKKVMAFWEGSVALFKEFLNRNGEHGAD